MSDPVDVVRRLSALVFKGLLIALAAVLGITLVIALGTLSYGWWTYDRHVENVQIRISTANTTECNDMFPLEVTTLNKSSRTLDKVEFTLAAREKGRSTNLVKDHTWSDDHIIPPKQGYGMCWAVPALTENVDKPRELEWFVKWKRFTFQE